MHIDSTRMLDVSSPDTLNYYCGSLLLEMSPHFARSRGAILHSQP